MWRKRMLICQCRIYNEILILDSLQMLQQYAHTYLNLLGLELHAYVVVQFYPDLYPWFKFYFLLFQTHYHILPFPKTKGNKI